MYCCGKHEHISMIAVAASLSSSKSSISCSSEFVTVFRMIVASFSVILGRVFR